MNQLFDLLIRNTSLSLTGFIILCVVSFLGSLIAGALGLGGGVLVLAIMANLLPPTALVPLHGVVQLGSNRSRAVLSWRQTVVAIVAPFGIGSLIGAALDAQFVVALPKHFLQVIIALFILFSTWVPTFQSTSAGRLRFFCVGALTTIVTMFVGGTGVLVGRVRRTGVPGPPSVRQHHSVVMTVQRGFKIIAFAVLGFAFGPYIPLLIGLVLFSFLGSYAGKLALHRLPEWIFRLR